MPLPAGTSPELSAPGTIRTCDPRLRKPVLYPLSYGRLMGRGAHPSQAVERCTLALMGLLRLRALDAADLPEIGWAGDPLRLRAIARALERVATGEVEYLAVAEGAGGPVRAIGGVDFTVEAQAGTLWQLITHPEHRGRGIGSVLIRGLEERILARGLTEARLRVRVANTRARALYERLGYRAMGITTVGWDALAPSGRAEHVHARCVLMARQVG